MVDLDRMDAFLLKSHIYNALPIVIALTAIAISVFLVGVKETNGKKEIAAKNAVLISMASILLLFCIGITLKAIYCNENYSVVPNIYGMTYDNALSSLREADLDGRLALASTNENLANADTRVVWQSKDAGGIVAKGTSVVFVIDDNFAIESVPLTAYTAEKKSESHTVHSWNWVADKSNKNWIITIPIKKASFQATTYRNGDGVSVTTGEWFFTDICAADMSRSLSQIVEETCKQYTAEPPASDLYIVKKLIPTQMDNRIALKSFENDLFNGVSILPRYLKEGSYRFAFCLCDSSGKSFEWEHTILIEPYED